MPRATTDSNSVAYHGETMGKPQSPKLPQKAYGAHVWRVWCAHGESSDAVQQALAFLGRLSSLAAEDRGLASEVEGRTSQLEGTKGRLVGQAGEVDRRWFAQGPFLLKNALFFVFPFFSFLLRVISLRCCVARGLEAFPWSCTARRIAHALAVLEPQSTPGRCGCLGLPSAKRHECSTSWDQSVSDREEGMPPSEETEPLAIFMLCGWCAVAHEWLRAQCATTVGYMSAAI